MQRRRIWKSVFARRLRSMLQAARTTPRPSAVQAFAGHAGAETLTLFLPHDQTRTVEAIQEHLRSTGFWRDLSPAGVEVVSWYVLTDISQVVTLLIPATTACDDAGPRTGGYPAELFERYDFGALYQQLQGRCP